jgi:hypothetical protein
LSLSWRLAAAAILAAASRAQRIWCHWQRLLLLVVILLLLLPPPPPLLLPLPSPQHTVFEEMALGGADAKALQEVTLSESALAAGISVHLEAGDLFVCALTHLSCSLFAQRVPSCLVRTPA